MSKIFNLSKKDKIIKPSNNHPNPKWRHAGDTFRQIIDMWKEAGYVEVEESDAEPGVVWFNKENDVLLYDRPTLEWYPNNIKCNMCLFGNPQPLPSTNSQKNFPWIFWGRNPKLLEHKSKNIKTYEMRKTESIFIGNIENSVQNKYRESFSKDDWTKVIKKFEIVMGNKHKYSQEEYLDMLNDSLFGLSIRGYGPKCNREIELMAMGVVPLLTEDVDVTYHDPLIDGLHYFRVKSPTDVTDITSKCNKTRWEIMSIACRKWYERNCSIKGSYMTTKRIINLNNSESRKSKNITPSCISTMCTKGSWNDLKLMLYSFYQFHPNLKVFIVCDSFVKKELDGGWINENTPNLEYVCIQTLDQYSKMDRRVMEQNGKWLEFMLRKCDSIDAAFQEGYLNTLFVDCDMVFLNTIEFNGGVKGLDGSLKQIGRSPHHNKKENQAQFGKYNGGFLWINSPGFTDWWKFASLTQSRYYEQAILENTDKNYTSFDIPMEYNYGWWRLYECEPNLVQERERLFRVVDNIVVYDNKPLRTIHTHFGEKKFAYTVKFNNYMMKLLIACKDERQKRIYDFINETFYGVKRNRTDSLPKTQSNVISKNVNENKEQILENEVVNGVKDVENDMENDVVNDVVSDVSDVNDVPIEKVINLIVHYYNDENEERQNEIDYCFNANIENPNVKRTHVMVTSGTKIPKWLNSGNNVSIINVGDNESLNSYGSLTFREMFEYANENIVNLDENGIVCVCNSDIFLDHNSNWSEARKLLDMNMVLALSRHEFDGIGSAKKDENLQKLGYAHVQDAWIFKTPFVVRDCNFQMKEISADTCIADRIKNSGFIPVNSPNKFKIFHYQKSSIDDKIKNDSKRLEERGYYLLPDIDSIDSIDNVIKVMGLGPIQKYSILCDILSKHLDYEDLKSHKY